MSFTDTRHGWLGFDGGIIAATTDGGHTWTNRYKAKQPQASIQDIDFIDSGNGYALVGWEGPVTPTGIPFLQDVIRTHDGGLTWSVATAESVGIGCIDFLTPAVGYALTASGQLAVTQDAGATWAGIATPGVAKATCFEAAGAGWVATAAGVAHTLDGGAHWITSYAPSLTAVDDRVQCLGRSAWVSMNLGAGMSQTAAVIARTLDDGAHWRAIDNQGIGGPGPGTPDAPDILEAHPGPFQLTSTDDACLTSSSSINDDVRFTTTYDGGATAVQHEVVHDATNQFSEGPLGLSFITPSDGWLLLVGSALHITTASLRGEHVGSVQVTGTDPDDLILLRTTNAGETWTVEASFRAGLEVS